MKTFVSSGLTRAATLCGLLSALAGLALAVPGPFTLVTATPKALTPATLAAAQKTVTHGQASPDKESLTFGQKVVRLVVTSGPPNDMLSYRIAGLRNPTLIVPHGATLRVLFVNTDDDMTHNLRFMVQKPRFKGAVKAVGTTNLPHKSETAFHAEELTVRVPAHAGTYAYLCTVPGHAPGGMYGTLIVR